MNTRQQNRYLILDFFASGPVSLPAINHCPIFSGMHSHPDAHHEYDEYESVETMLDAFTYQLGLLRTSVSAPVSHPDSKKYQLSLLGYQEWQRLNRKYQTHYAEALSNAHRMAAGYDWYDSARQILSPGLFGVFAFRQCGQSIEHTYQRFNCSVFAVCDRYRFAFELVKPLSPMIQRIPEHTTRPIRDNTVSVPLIDYHPRVKNPSHVAPAAVNFLDGETLPMTATA